jgi:hypothetical protein
MIWAWPLFWADGSVQTLDQLQRWPLPDCSSNPYVYGAGDDALALQFVPQAGPDSAAPVVDFALSCMHIPVRWQFLQLIQTRPLPGRGEGSD